MTDEIKRRFSLLWQSQGHDQVRTEADQVDAALDAVAQGVQEVARRSEAGSGAVRGLGEGLGTAERRLAAVDRAADQASRGLDRLEQRTVGVAAGFKGVGAAVTAALGAIGASKLLDLAEEGSGLQLVSRRLNEVGFGAEKVTDIMQRLGGGSTANVERLVSRANEAGVAFESMGSLADASLQLASARGLESHAVMEQLTQAVTTGRAAWLKKQGILVDVKAAQDDYAKSVGRTVAELSEQEKIAASSEAIIAELNAAFGGRAPDKYASNIGAVRERLDNLADLIKRKLADALNDLGAVLSGGIFNASFASPDKGSRTQQIAKQVGQLEDAEARLASAAKRGASAVADVVLALQDELGADTFTAMMGLPGGTEVSRITAAYIGAQERVARQLATAREQLDVATAAEDYAEAETAAAEAAEAEAAAAERRSREAAKAAAARARELEKERREAEALLDFWSGLEVEAAMAEALTPDAVGIDFDALGGLIADGLNAGLDRVQRLGDALGIGDVEAQLDPVFALFETLGEHAANARSVLGDVSSTVGVMGQIGALESGNAIQRAKNRARDAKGEKERLAAQKALLAAERAAEKERRRLQAVDFALKAADNAGAAIEETAKAAGAYPDPVGMALHGFAALKHGAAAVFYGKGVAASLSAPSAVGGSGAAGLGPGTPSAPTRADRPPESEGRRGSQTTIVLNGILADGRSVRTALADGLNTVGDGQVPIDNGGR